jgi:hypothetical protein
MIRSVAWVLLAGVCSLGACGKDKKVDQLEATDWCADELNKIVVPQMLASYEGGDAGAFHRATDKFMQGTMCGPDFAEYVRQWEESLRDTDAAKGNAKRKAIVTELRATLSAMPEYDSTPEHKALAPLFEKAK